MQQFLHIFTENIGFYVHCVSHSTATKCGDFERVGDQRDAESFRFNVDQSQAHTIDGNRTFGNHQCRQLSRHAKLHRHPVAVTSDGIDGASPVDVSLDEVPSQPR